MKTRSSRVNFVYAGLIGGKGRICVA